MRIIVKNKKAFYDYEIIDKYEAGIILQGSEVKAIKSGHISIKESFISINNKVILKNSLVSIPSYAKQFSEDEKRDKYLLLNKKEIKELKKGVQRNGYTIVALDIYENDKGKIKLTIALVKGKKDYEKRDSIKERDLSRQIKDY